MRKLAWVELVEVRLRQAQPIQNDDVLDYFYSKSQRATFFLFLVVFL